jgi:diguanylate cyclase (GGDEF)-like protein
VNVDVDAFTDDPQPPAARPVASLPPAAAQVISLALPLIAAGASSVRALGVLVAIAGAVVVGLPFLVGLARSRPVVPPDTAAVLAVLLAFVLPPLAATASYASPLLPVVLALSSAMGALLPGKTLSRVLPAHAIAVGVTVALAGVSALVVVEDALFVLGFGALGRALFFGTLRAAALREEARVDAELLRLYDDARLFRLVGHDDDDDEFDADTRRRVAQTLSVRDGFYRLLRLGARAIKSDGLAIYLLNDASELVLKEQLLDVDGTCEPQLTSTAGAFGLALKKGVPVRLLVHDDPRLAPHRTHVGSILAVPLPDGQIARGVLVVDRARATAFTDDDEAIALGLAMELLQLVRTERTLDEAEDDRKRQARVFAAARAFGGVVKKADAVEVAHKTAFEVAPISALVLVELVRENSRDLLRVRAAEGLDVEVGAVLPLSDDTWVGRAIAQGTALPHVALVDTDTQRGVLAVDDERAAPYGDVRAVPLFAQGVPMGALVVATPPGEKLRRRSLDALHIIADLAGVAIGGAHAVEALEKQATTDGLTGLYNRRTLDRLLPEALARARRQQQPLCVVLSDIDHFKSVNDTYGHGTGDDVLKAVAQALGTTARLSDVVARYGGEEFCMVLEATDLAGAVRLAERMRLAVRALRFDTPKGPLTVTMSFGVSLCTEATVDMHDLLTRADTNLYKAKQAGRDRVVS